MTVSRNMELLRAFEVVVICQEVHLGILGQDCMCPVEMCGSHMAADCMAHGR